MALVCIFQEMKEISLDFPKGSCTVMRIKRLSFHSFNKEVFYQDSKSAQKILTKNERQR